MPCFHPPASPPAPGAAMGLPSRPAPQESYYYHYGAEGPYLARSGLALPCRPLPPSPCLAPASPRLSTFPPRLPAPGGLKPWAGYSCTAGAPTVFMLKQLARAPPTDKAQLHQFHRKASSYSVEVARTLSWAVRVRASLRRLALARGGTLRGLQQCHDQLKEAVPCLLRHAHRLNLSAPASPPQPRRLPGPRTVAELLLERLPSRRWEEGWTRMRAISFSAPAQTTGRWATYTLEPETERPAYAKAPTAATPTADDAAEAPRARRKGWIGLG